MPRPHSTPTPKSDKPKAKPFRPKGFPLFAHNNGQWAIKVKKKIYYFGPWADSDAALERWLEVKDDLLAGRKPRKPKDSNNSLDAAVQNYLAFIDKRVQRGELSPRWLEDLRSSLRLLLETVGREVSIDALEPDDFAAVSANSWIAGKATKRRASPLTAQKHIHRIRGFFNWCREQRYIPGDPIYGAEFYPPKKDVIERHKNAKHDRYFNRSQIRALLRESKSSPMLFAAILLAINTGCQNEDIATLQVQHIDLRRAWYKQPRSKKGTKRRAKLWGRTVRALRAVLTGREVQDGDLVFLSRSGGKWHGRNCLAKEFAELKVRAGITTPGAGFQWLRHSFITQASQGGDLLAVQLACGHADKTITQNYIHAIYAPRLEAIAAIVESWLIGKGGAK